MPFIREFSSLFKKNLSFLFLLTVLILRRHVLTELSLMQVNETWNIKWQISGGESELFVVLISYFDWLVWTFSNFTCFAWFSARWCFPLTHGSIHFERIVLFFLFSFYSELFPFFCRSFLHVCVAWSFKLGKFILCFLWLWNLLEAYDFFSLNSLTIRMSLYTF